LRGGPEQREPTFELSDSGSGGAGGKGTRLLSVIGAINWDISIFEERFARTGEEVPVNSVQEFSGGKGANVAVAAARILGRGRVAYLGALGDDEIRVRQLAELESEGVVVDGVTKIAGCQSGRAYILVDGKGRKTIHTHFGANSRVTPLHLKERGCRSITSRTGMMVVMDPPTEVALAAAQAARRAGARVIYSPGVRTQEGAESLEKTMKMTDFLVLDRIELMNIYDARDEEAALRAANAKHPRMTVVATLGPEGCAVASGGSVRRVAGFESSKVGGKVLNTTGCGDAFLGVFSSVLFEGADPLEATNWANLAGAMKATRLETRGSPKRAALEGAMRRVSGRRGSALGS
jgi:ribokinase